ncbi:hypothetical protein [Halomonas sp. SL1]|uniref:hypothetical protein n=1 Tax=Halomonas sp. SL1 TaxID=2137478 RepID=UPI000D168AEB|nr:hypothetical protein [Halomonas sp. SL1]RAH37433.1 hypothetical protein C9J49_011060 [Halomonas sp. SL1]
MMTTAQKSALASVLDQGGTLQLSGFLAPISVQVERATPDCIGKDVAHVSITEGDFLVCRYPRGNSRDLCLLVAERLDDLVVGGAA